MKIDEVDLQEIAPGINSEKYYLAFRMLLMLWRNMWNNSRTDWSRYRRDAWHKFGEWCVGAAQRARTIDRFLSNFARKADISQMGTNQDERDFVVTLLALSEREQRDLLRQVRNDMPVLSGLVRLYQTHKKATYKAMMEEHNEEA